MRKQQLPGARQFWPLDVSSSEHTSAGTLALRRARRRYEADIKTVKAQGANSFRFSFEWARLEPDASGKFDEEAFVRCVRAG